MGLPAKLCDALLLLLLATAVGAELDACASNPSECRMTGAEGPLDGSDVTATAQGGPIGAAQTPSTVTGTLTFSFETFGGTSDNMFAFPGTGSVSDATYNQQLPAGPTGTYGNELSPITVPIRDWVEFASVFGYSGCCTTVAPTIPPTIQPAVSAPILKVLVDIAQAGSTASISVTTEQLVSTTPPSTQMVGTLELQSSLFIGATVSVVPQRLEDVLADSFELKGMQEEEEEEEAQAAAAAAAAAPSDGGARGQATTQAAQPAQSGVSAGVGDSTAGMLRFTLASSAFTSDSATQTNFAITLVPQNPCAVGGSGGSCCAGGSLKIGGVCRSAPKGSCQLDSVCDGVNANCPASPNKLHGTPCPWSPSRSYLMGEAVDTHNAKVMAVSAHDAAAWLTGKPAYDTEWPECEGVCIQGGCALRWNHPACCYVRPRDSYGYREDNGRPYESQGEKGLSVSSFGYWRSRNWYCWK